MYDFVEIIKILICHFYSMDSDQGTSTLFPYDPGVKLFIVATGECLQVHQLHLATSVFPFLFVGKATQLFESVFYIRPIVEPVTPLIVNAPTISIWDPGQLGCVNFYWSNFSVVDNYYRLTCPLITYSLVFVAYYVVKHDFLATNFQLASVLHPYYITALVGMVQVWEVKVLRSVYNMKA